MLKRHSLFLIATLFYIIGVLGYALISYHHGKKIAIINVDKTLNSIAIAADFLMNPYHEKIQTEKLNAGEMFEIMNKKLNTMNRNFESTYIYSFIQIDNKILFSSSSYTKADILNEKVSKFLEPYDSATPVLINAFVNGKTSIEESNDKWGNFRSILVPQTTSNGLKYIIGVDIEISEINNMLYKKLISTTFTGLFFLVLVIPFGIIYIISLKKEKEILSKMVDERTIELKTANQSLNQINTELSTLSNKLSKYLSPQIFDSLFQGKMDVKIESKRKNLTIFFSDIKDFTKLSQDLKPKELTNLINNYLVSMSEIANEFGGTIDKFIGDAIMIFFGDPGSEGPQKDAIKCVKMALAMQEKIKEIREQEPFKSLPRKLQIRIGISTGICTVGNFGSPNHMDYTIIGNEVNLASRLESSAEPDGILISSTTHELVKNSINCSPLGEIKVKGFDTPIKTFKAISLAETTAIK